MNNIHSKHATKVNFLIAGVQKGGTTALDYYLRQHPEVCMAIKKEVHFFDNEKLFSNDKQPDYSIYHRNFNCNKNQRLLGESTPIYSYWKPASKRIFEYNKKMKIIVLLRNPIERAFSHWNKETINYHSYANKQTEAVETLSFYNALINEKSRTLEALPMQHRYYSYVDRGLYSQQIENILRYFSRNQLLILKSEWLRHDAENTLNKVYDFLQISHQSLPKAPIGGSIEKKDKSSPVDNPSTNLNNSGHYKSIKSKRAKDYLIVSFKDDITNLEKLLDWDCQDWLE